MVILKWNAFEHLFVLLSHSFLALCARLDWSFGNCFSCLGCLTVAPICSDYMHTEWTQCRNGWLPITNVPWHPNPPWAAILFLGLSVSSLFYDPVANVFHLISWTDMQLAIYSWSMRGLLDSWANQQMYERRIQAPIRVQVATNWGRIHYVKMMHH